MRIKVTDDIVTRKVLIQIIKKKKDDLPTVAKQALLARVVAGPNAASRAGLDTAATAVAQVVAPAPAQEVTFDSPLHLATEVFH